MEGMEGPEEMDKKQTNRSDAEPTYPSTAKVIPIVLALYMSMFLVALVSPPTLPLYHDPRLTFDRTVQSLQPLFLKSQTTSTPLAMSDGMPAPIC